MTVKMQSFRPAPLLAPPENAERPWETLIAPEVDGIYSKLGTCAKLGQWGSVSHMLVMTRQFGLPDPGAREYKEQIVGELKKERGKKSAYWVGRLNLELKELGLQTKVCQEDEKIMRDYLREQTGERASAKGILDVRYYMTMLGLNHGQLSDIDRENIGWELHSLREISSDKKDIAEMIHMMQKTGMSIEPTKEDWAKMQREVEYHRGHGTYNFSVYPLYYIHKLRPPKQLTEGKSVEDMPPLKKL